MVKKVKKGQLLWTITSEDEVVHGHVKNYGKDLFKKQEIVFLHGDAPLNLPETDSDACYMITYGSPSSFYYTRQAAIDSLIKEVKADLKKRQEFLDLLCSERKKLHTKDVVFNQHTSPGKFNRLEGALVEIN